MKLELSESEVKGLGERRWLKRYWKKTIVLVGGLLVASLLSAILSGLCVETEWVRLTIVLPILTLWLISCIFLMVKMDKAGKQFLREQKQ